MASRRSLSSLQEAETFQGAGQRRLSPEPAVHAGCFRVYGLLLVCKSLFVAERFDCSRVSGLCVVRIGTGP